MNKLLLRYKITVSDQRLEIIIKRKIWQRMFFIIVIGLYYSSGHFNIRTAAVLVLLVLLTFTYREKIEFHKKGEYLVTKKGVVLGIPVLNYYKLENAYLDLELTITKRKELADYDSGTTILRVFVQIKDTDISYLITKFTDKEDLEYFSQTIKDFNGFTIRETK
ncbi:MAG: hypothetical protein IPP64_05250 [Bacteroidetes bacterium]|nr:hypothetical protein [Bacteroidota bacterium]